MPLHTRQRRLCGLVADVIPAQECRRPGHFGGEREILDRLAQQFELLSCWQAARPGRPLAQTLRWTGDRKEPYHCDGIFAPASWQDRLVSCRVLRGSRWYKMSNHNPVIAEFNF